MPPPATLVLYGGPRDGELLPLDHQPDGTIPDTAPGHPQYRLVGPHAYDDSRWVYAWDTEHSGRRQACEAYGGKCEHIGCPNRKARR